MSAFYAGLAEIFEIAEADITADFDLAGHTWDSLAMDQTSALIDECFNRMVYAQALAACATVADIEALIRQDAAKVA